ncbi:MAG: hypothetical protein ACFFCW_35745 [Candidatus Hodarchaeota archaeon]
MEFVGIGKIPSKEAADEMGVPHRHAKRIRRGAEKGGIKGMVYRSLEGFQKSGQTRRIHGIVLALSRGHYKGIDDTHFTRPLGCAREFAQKLCSHIAQIEMVDNVL